MSGHRAGSHQYGLSMTQNDAGQMCARIRTFLISITLALVAAFPAAARLRSAMATAVAAAAGSGSNSHSTVELVAPQKSLAPGRSFWVGLHFKLEKQWHIYWINPGDSGEPPKVDWRL